MSAHIQQVIITELDIRGEGTDSNPYRRIRQFWALDGKLLGEVDHFQPMPDNVVPIKKFTNQEPIKNA